MKHPLLVAELRSVLGRKIKKLRREGLLPANVYGKHLNSTSLQLSVAEFEEVHKQVGETGIVDLKVGDDVKPVLIKSLQYDWKSHMPLHVDFYQVNLREKIKAMIPVLVIGEPTAVSEKLGILLQTLYEVEVEALPDNLPEGFEVNVETLAAVDDHVAVGSLKAPEGVEILTDASQVIAKIGELAAEEVEPEPEVEEGAEGEAAAEGEEGEAKEESTDEEKVEEAAKEE